MAEGGGPAAASMASLLMDEAMSHIAEFLPMGDALAVAALSSAWVLPARVDRVWIRFCRSEWRFGTMFGAADGAAPGERDDSSLERWRESMQPGCAVSQDAFKFFLGRREVDGKVRDLVKQLAPGSGDASGDPRDVRRKLLEHGDNALDALLHMERSASSGLQQHARAARQEMSDAWAAGKWAQLMATPEQASALEEGALVLSQWAKADVDVPVIRATLEEIASSAAAKGARRTSDPSRPPSRAEAEGMIMALNTVLFDEFGLRGNAQDYYNTDNSFLHAVLENRRGIPISLCIVWAAVARRQGLPCHLLAGFPRHVLIRVQLQADGAREGNAATDIYVDAFDRGQTMGWTELKRFASQMLGPALGFSAEIDEGAVREWVDISPPVDIYMRLLRNLCNIYQQKGDHACLMGILTQMRALGNQSAELTTLQAALAHALGREPPGR